MAVSTSGAATFQDSRPPPDAVPVTVLPERSTQIRCSLPDMPTATLHETIPTTMCATFGDYISTLPLWERDLLVNATEEYLPDYPLYQLLQQRNVNILVASDGGHEDDYGSFGWVIGTKDEVICDCQGIARGYPMQSYRAEGYGRMSLFLFLTRYIRYYGIQPADDLRVTSYCDSDSLLKAEEEFHARDVDSAFWYLKSDHDVIMTISEIRRQLPFKLVSLHVRSHQDDEYDFSELTRPAQLNVLADHRATAALNELRAAGQPTEFYPLPACRAYLCDATGYLTSKEQRTLQTELPEYNLRAYIQERNNWSDEIYDSISWSAYRSATDLLTDSARTFVIKFTHSWLPIGVRESRCSATTALCAECNEVETVPHLYRCQARGTWRNRFLVHFSGHLDETHTADNIRCKLLDDIQHWFLTGDTNDPASNDNFVQICWFQVLKGYIPIEWTLQQEAYCRKQRYKPKYYNGDRWAKQLIDFFWMHTRPLWKDRCTAAHAPGEDS